MNIYTIPRTKFEQKCDFIAKELCKIYTRQHTVCILHILVLGMPTMEHNELIKIKNSLKISEKAYSEHT